MRDLMVVIDRIKLALPTNMRDEMSPALDDFKSSISCAAPEMMLFWWGEVAVFLSCYIDGYSKEGWKKEVVKIFNGE